MNGSPSGFFGSSRGLRQGEPLSPFLFIMVTEAFSRMTSRAMGANMIRGFQLGMVRGNPVNVSHLLFADDTIVFCNARVDQMRYLRCILLCFQALSGLKINLAKSEIIPVGDNENIEFLAGILGCRLGSLPSSYLGLPLGASSRASRFWDSVLERFEKTLAGWKRQYLSKVGRLTLIKSSLCSLPAYFMSLFPIPSSVSKRMEKLQRDFLCMYKRDVECVNHLLSHCPVARELLMLLPSLSRTQWVMPASSAALVYTWRGCLVQRRARDIWRVAPLCLWWTARREK